MVEETSDGSGSFVVNSIQNIHHLKIDLEKFDETNSFEL